MFEKIKDSIKKHSGLYTILLIFTVIAMSIYTADAGGTPTYVTQLGAGTKDGTSWNNAMGETELVTALQNVASNGEFWIAQGEYRPSVTGDATKSFTINNDIELYGGFKGDETALDQRNIYKYKTVLTGDLANDDIGKENGITTSTININGTNSEHVIKYLDASHSLIVDGIFITAGNAAPNDDGGGILIEAGSPTIRKCTFAGNRSTDRGGAIASINAETAPLIEQCTFYGNGADSGNGGAIYLASDPLSGQARVINSTFDSNFANEKGGAIYLSTSSAGIANSTFVNNSVGDTGNGSAIYIKDGSATLVNSIIWHNLTGASTEQIEVFSGTTATVSYCVVEGGYTAGTNIITDDPLLNAFEYKGGYNKSYIIADISSARDAGFGALTPSEDQRGITRVSPFDIGAVEYSTTLYGVYIDSAKASLGIDGTKYLNAISLPGEVTEAITWSSDNIAVATVVDGLVTGVSEGLAVITATSGAFSDTCEITVTKSTPTVSTWPLTLNITYGQTLATCFLSSGTASVPGAFAWGDPTIMPTVADSGVTDFEVIFTPTDTTRYNTVTGAIKVTVDKATPTLVTLPSASEITYGDSLANSILTGGEMSVTGSFAWKDASTEPAVIDSESTNYIVVFTPDDTGNNNTKEENVTVKVIPATIDYTVSMYRETYDGAEHSITLTVAEPIGAEIHYGTTADQITLTEKPAFTEVGNHTVYFKIEHLNYKTVTGSSSVNILKVKIMPVLPPDTPASVKAEVKVADAEFTENKDDVIAKMATNLFLPDNLVANATTKLIEVNGELAVKLFNDRDEYKAITITDITRLPIFVATVESGKTVAVAFKVQGKDFFATTPDKIKIMKIMSNTESDFFTYAASSSQFADGKYTLQTATNPLYTGTIEANTEYLLVLFIKDGGRFDLDKVVNGEVVDPSAIIKLTKKDDPIPPTPPTPGPDDGGGGCNTSLPLQLMFLAIPFIFKLKK